MVRRRRKIGEILVALGVLTPPEVTRVLEAMQRRPDRRKFGQLASSLGLMREEHIFAALAAQMHLFPGVEQMSPDQILQFLRDSALKRPSA